LLKFCFLKGLPEVFNHFPNSPIFFKSLIGAKISADAYLFAFNLALLASDF
jgi:hypothetical protein